MIFVFIAIAGICIAFANGANDNFKGVATLFGSGTTNYRTALIWATATTLSGSIAALLLAGGLLASFGGKGLVEDAVAGQPAFAAAVAFGAGLTVLIATRFGLPISTTHAIVGALVGTGMVAGSSLNLATLGSKFVAPLLASPLLALVATTLLYPTFRFARKRLGIEHDLCLCVGSEAVEVVPADCHGAALQRAEQMTVIMGKSVTCENRYRGAVLGVSAGKALDKAHFLSSGMVSFARGLNDTPKIAALLLIVPAIGVRSGLVLTGIAMAVGGVVCARRVAETMSKRITTMNHGQGFTANLVTGLIVIGASRMGLPVSTTHVSCGSLFGIGTVTGGARKKTIAGILLAWVVTLPLAGALAALVYFIVSQFQ